MNVAGNLAAGVAKITAVAPMGPWVDRAACTGADPDMFHPTRGESTRQAVTVCLGCPVRAECLDWALRTDQRFGIWGGLSERARRRLRETNPELELVDSRECPSCGAVFRPGRRNQRFCSADCRNWHRTAWGRP